LLLVSIRVSFGIHSPVEPQSVQESRQSLHEDQHAQGQDCPGGEDGVEYDEVQRLVRPDAHGERPAEDHAPQNFGEFCKKEKGKKKKVEELKGLIHSFPLQKKVFIYIYI
jgi:hypothetical protein